MRQGKDRLLPDHEREHLESSPNKAYPLENHVFPIVPADRDIRNLMIIRKGTDLETVPRSRHHVIPVFPELGYDRLEEGYMRCIIQIDPYFFPIIRHVFHDTIPCKFESRFTMVFIQNIARSFGNGFQYSPLYLFDKYSRNSM